MNKWIELSAGLVILIISLLAWIYDFAGFGTAALSFLKGGLVWIAILIGIVFIVLGISDLRE